METKHTFPLQLPDPTLPAPWVPVAQNKGGLGVDELRKNPPVPVRVTALADRGLMPGALMTLFWGGFQVDSYILRQEQIDTGLLSFDVSPGEIVDGENIEVSYRSLTAEGLNPTVSFPCYIRVNTQVPGDPPLNPSEPVNAGLSPPSGIPRPVTDAHVATGIDVIILNWVNMEADDVVTLTWGNTRIAHPPLTIGEVNRPVTIHVDGDTILANSNTLGLKIYYDIRDIVGNWSLNSKPFITDIEAGPNTMPAPRITEAQGDDDIALPELGSSDAHVIVPVYSPWAVNDNVTVLWEGLTAGGIRVDERVSYFTQADEEGFSVTKEITNATVAAIGGGSAIVYYEVNGTRRSRRKAITVSGTTQRLAGPTIAQQSGGVLDPARVPQTGATVIVKAIPGMDVGDTVYLYWDGLTAAGGTTQYSTQTDVTDSNADITFTVEKAKHVVPLAGGSLKLHYTLVNGAVSRESETTSYSVAPLSAAIREDFTGQPPQLLQAGATLDTGLISIHFMDGLGYAGFPQNDKLPENPGAIAMPALHVCYQNPLLNPGIQSIQIDLRQACTTFECDIHGLNGTTTISLLNSSLGLIDSVTPSTQTNYHFSYTTTSEPIRFLRIVADKDWTRWDNFVMTP